jgi:predicted metalloendopeptidase
LIIKEQLESNSTIGYSDAENKAKQFYSSCIDKNSTIERLGSKPLKNILNKFIFKNETTNQININDTFDSIFELMQFKFGVNAFFEFDVLDDDKNSSFSNIEVNFSSIFRSFIFFLILNYLKLTDKSTKFRIR